MYFGTNSIFATLNMAKYSVCPTEKNLVTNYLLFSSLILLINEE